MYVGIYVFLSVSYCLPFLSYFTNAGFHSVVNCFLSFWLGELQCVRPLDLSWADIDSLQVEVAVVKKDSPNPEDLMPTDVQNIIGEFAETNKKLFLQFELKEYIQPVIIPSTSSDEVTIVDNPKEPQCSIVDALMKKTNHYPQLKMDCKNNTMSQYNTIVHYIKNHNFGVRNVELTEYTNMIDKFQQLLWEIDPHYDQLRHGLLDSSSSP